MKRSASVIFSEGQVSSALEKQPSDFSVASVRGKMKRRPAVHVSN
jgi:hypothetical protein